MAHSEQPDTAMSPLSRRAFLSAAALASTGTAAAVLGGCAAASPSPEAAPSAADAGGARSAPSVAQDPVPSPDDAADGARSATRFSADGKGYAYEQDGWTVVHIEGEPYERGRQHGELVSEALGAMVEQVRGRAFDEYGVPWDFLKTQAAAQWTDDVGDELAEELRGIAEGAAARGAAVDFADVLAWNAHNELFDCFWSDIAAACYEAYEPDPHNAGAPNVAMAPQVPSGNDDHCSAFIATGSATADGHVLLAHNTFGDFSYAQHLNVLVDLVPAEGSRILFQGAPGYVHSPTDYYNSEHLIVTATGIGGFNAYDRERTPLFVRGRMAVQYAKDLDDFAARVSENNDGGSAVAWLVGDIATDEIMLFEQGLKFSNVQKTRDGVFCSCNAPMDPRIRNFETTNSGFGDIRRHQGARQARFAQLFAEGFEPVTVEGAQYILADHFDVYTNSENPCSRTICSHYELDAREYMSQPGRPLPFQPRGATDGIVATASMAKSFELSARWGSSCGTPFSTRDFLARHPQYEYLRPYLIDRPTRPWTTIKPTP